MKKELEKLDYSKFIDEKKKYKKDCFDPRAYYQYWFQSIDSTLYSLTILIDNVLSEEENIIKFYSDLSTLSHQNCFSISAFIEECSTKIVSTIKYYNAMPTVALIISFIVDRVLKSLAIETNNEIIIPTLLTDAMNQVLNN